MKKKNFPCVLASIIAPLITGTASAALFDFTPGNFDVAGNQSYNLVGMELDGLRLEISSYVIENDGLGTIASMAMVSGDGLGVYVSRRNNLGVTIASGDYHSMDGGNASRTDLDEGLLFSFDKMVSLDYINFDLFSGDDDFNLTVDGELQLLDFNGLDRSFLASQVAGQSDEFNFFNITGQEFIFWADAANDEFRIDSLAVSAVPGPSVSFLLGVGFAGMYFMWRKRE